eukprot:gene24619-10240_t
MSAVISRQYASVRVPPTSDLTLPSPNSLSLLHLATCHISLRENDQRRGPDRGFVHPTQVHTAYCNFRSLNVCPLRSAWSNKLISAKDHASVQLNIGHLNDEGVYNGQFTTFALTGRVRGMMDVMPDQDVVVCETLHQISETIHHHFGSSVRGMGEADSAIDLMWKKKQAEVASA